MCWLLGGACDTELPHWRNRKNTPVAAAAVAAAVAAPAAADAAAAAAAEPPEEAVGVIVVGAACSQHGDSMTIMLICQRLSGGADQLPEEICKCANGGCTQKGSSLRWNGVRDLQLTDRITEWSFCENSQNASPEKWLHIWKALQRSCAVAVQIMLTRTDGHACVEDG